MNESANESFYRIETRTVRAAGGGYYGAFKVYLPRGPAMALIHVGNGVGSPAFATEVGAWDDASRRAERWIAGGGLARAQRSG